MSKSVNIPPVPLTQIEDTLLCCIMPACPDFRYYKFFGVPERQSMSKDLKINLYGSLLDEQKNILKRDFLIENMVQGNGIVKRTALSIELGKHHFLYEMAEIENIHNEEYLKKQADIRDRMEKLRPKVEEP